MKETRTGIYKDVDITNMAIQKKETVIKAKYKNNFSRNYDPAKTE